MNTCSGDGWVLGSKGERNNHMNRRLGLCRVCSWKISYRDVPRLCQWLVSWWFETAELVSGNTARARVGAYQASLPKTKTR